MKRETSDKPYLARLDVLRGIAALMVYCYHACTSQGILFPPWEQDQWWRLPNDLPVHSLLFLPFLFGWAGVPLFFVLSGFVIHTSTLSGYRRTGRFDIAGFYWRRFWRIYPVYFVAVAAFAAQEYHRGTTRMPFQIVTHLLMLHNAWSETIWALSPAFWSLATECQFYLAYPLLWWIRVRWGMNRTFGFMGVISIVGLAFAAIRQNWNLPPNALLWLSPFATWIQWGLGAFLAERYATGKSPIRCPRWAIVLLFFVSVAGTFSKALFTIQYSAVAVLCFFLIQSTIYHQSPLRSWEKPLLAVGLISYSVYIWHQPVLWYLSEHLHLANTPLGRLPGYLGFLVPLLVWFAIASAICYALSVLSYRFIEMPGVQLGKRLRSE